MTSAPTGVTPERSPGRRGLPVAAQVLVAAGLLLLVLGGLLFSPTGVVSDPQPRGTLGEQETVRVSGPAGELYVPARVNTGAGASTLDGSLAERLGYDLDAAETVEVESAVGDDRRAVVPATLQVAGDVFATRVSIADLDDDGPQLLLGREDLRQFRVVVGETGMSDPGSVGVPTPLGRLLAESSALSPTSLLAVLPLATLVIVVLRVVVGVQTLGIFSPVLLAVGYSQAGLVPGLLLTTAMVGLGFVVQTVLGRLWLPRMVRLAVLVGMVVGSLLVLQELAGVSGAVDAWGASLPVVVTAVVIERVWETWELDGVRRAGIEVVVTLVVAAGVTWIMLLPPTRELGDDQPLLFALGATAAACAVGTYRGMSLLDRLTRSEPSGSQLPAHQKVVP